MDLQVRQNRLMGIFEKDSRNCIVGNDGVLARVIRAYMHNFSIVTNTRLPSSRRVLFYAAIAAGIILINSTAPRILGTCANAKIFATVIETIEIQMVNNFLPRERPFDNSFHDYAMQDDFFPFTIPGRDPGHVIKSIFYRFSRIRIGPPIVIIQKILIFWTYKKVQISHSHPLKMGNDHGI